MNNFFTLRFFLTISLWLIAVLGIVLQFSSSLVYQDMAFQSKSDFVQELVQIKSNDILNDLTKLQEKQAASLINEESFKSAIDNQDIIKLSEWMKELFHRYYVTTGIIDLESVVVLNKAYEVLVRENKLEHQETNNCLNIISLMRESKGNDQLKPKHFLCRDNEGPLSTVILPYGGLWPKGYVVLIVRTLHNLQKLPEIINLPLQILSSEHKLLFQSPNWLVSLPSKNNSNVPVSDVEDIRLIDFNYELPNKKSYFKLKIAIDHHELATKMEDTRLKLMLFSVLIIFIIAFFAGAFQNRVLVPLKSLERSSKRITDGIFETVDEDCIFPEISTPIKSFNVMVEALKVEIATKEEAQEKLIEEKQFSLVTLASIVDAVVSLKIDNTITYMNPKAEELIGGTLNDCETNDFDECFKLYSEPDGTKLIIFDEIIHNPDMNYHQAIVFFYDQFNRRLELEMAVSRMGEENFNDIGFVVVFNDVTVDRELKRQLSYEALHDSLTGLINRYEFERRALAFLESSYGDKNEHVLMFMDLDQFKLVNDTCGHLAGDELLKQLAVAVDDTIRSNDSWARLGGDEFGLLMGNCDLEHALIHAEKIADLVNNFRFSWEDQVFKIGISIGVAEFGMDGTSLSETLSYADSACYMSKNSGNKSIHVYTLDDKDLQEQQGAMNWVSKIHLGLEEDRFILYSQLIEPLNKFDAKHVELLIRYLDTDDNIVGPNAFLPAAERYKLSVSIDKWVINKSLEWIEENIDIIGDTVVGINLSGISLSDENFLNFIVERIEQVPMLSKHLCFEITETAVISNIQKAINFTASLQNMGCQLALDDFGSGLSSFAYLKNFPVDFLKIDGIFIKNIRHSPEDVVLVKAMVSVAHGLGMKTIAEFVEDKESIQLLTDLGVDYVQGWGVGKPKDLALWNE